MPMASHSEVAVICFDVVAELEDVVGRPLPVELLRARTGEVGHS